MCKLNVAVIFGGSSSEHEVSIRSASTIILNMSEEKYNIIPIYITKEGKWLMYEGPSKQNMSNIQWEKLGITTILNVDRTNKGLLRIVGNRVNTLPIDIIFPVIHGRNGEDGTIQGLFEISGIPYVGCDVISSAMSMDKAVTKIIADSVNIAQAKYLVFNKYELEDLELILKKIKSKIGYPCFIKPAREGSSVGINKAKNKKELKEAILNAFLYDKKIVVEKAILGREVECAILGNSDLSPKASCIGEVLAAAEFYDYDAKYNNVESKTVIPADIDEKSSSEIQEKAIIIYKALGCSGLSRVDFFIENETNKIIFNEINTLPGFTTISMYPVLWQKSGIDTPQLIDTLLELAKNK